MFNLPENTFYNKKIPKETFYSKEEFSSSLKRLFIDQVKTIYWRNKIATSTTNLSEGKIVKEIEIIEIRLKTNILNEDVLRVIDKGIPYHTIFLLENEGKCQASVSYKEIIENKCVVSLGEYFHSKFVGMEEFSLEMDGLNLDKVYENFFCQIAGDLLLVRKNEPLKDAIVRNLEIKKLGKQINALENKIRKEKQLNVQVKLNDNLKELSKKLKKLSKI